MIPSWKDPETQDLWMLIASEIALLPGMTDKIGSVSPSSLSSCKCMVGFRNATTGSTHGCLRTTGQNLSRAVNT